MCDVRMIVWYRFCDCFININMLLLIPVLMLVIVHKVVLTQHCTDSPPAVGEEAYLKFTSKSNLITCLKSLKVSYKPQNSSKFIDVLTCVMIGGNISCQDPSDLKYEFVNCSKGSLVIKIPHASKQCEGIYILSNVQEIEVVTCNLTLSENKTLHINESDWNKNPVQTTKNDSGHLLYILIPLGVIVLVALLLLVIVRLWKMNRLPQCGTPCHINTELESLHHPHQQNGNPPQESTPTSLLTSENYADQNGQYGQEQT